MGYRYTLNTMSRSIYIRCVCLLYISRRQIKMINLSDVWNSKCELEELFRKPYDNTEGEREKDI